MIIGCAKCGHLACVCNIERRHKRSCAFRIASASRVGIECRHGSDVCAICDPCTCGAGVAIEDFATAPQPKEA